MFAVEPRGEEEIDDDDEDSDVKVLIGPRVFSSIWFWLLNSESLRSESVNDESLVFEAVARDADSVCRLDVFVAADEDEAKVSLSLPDTVMVSEGAENSCL